jgi:hypothetical protein
MATRVAEQQAWERENRGLRCPDPSEFGVIRDGLAAVGLDSIADTIRVSRTAAGKIRSGQLVPHIRPWRPLADLAQVSPPEWSRQDASGEHGGEAGR